IGVLRQAIRFWVECCRQSWCTSYPLTKALPEVCNELRAPIRDYRVGKAFFSPYEIQERLHYCLGSNRVHRKELLLLA
ncbi:hypothetical protein K402DRAFT_302387, partial [Aulographum hederae CBS 113979]